MSNVKTVSEKLSASHPPHIIGHLLRVTEALEVSLGSGFAQHPQHKENVLEHLKMPLE